MTFHRNIDWKLIIFCINFDFIVLILRFVKFPENDQMSGLSSKATNQRVAINDVIIRFCSLHPT